MTGSYIPVQMAKCRGECLRVDLVRLRNFSYTPLAFDSVFWLRFNKCKRCHIRQRVCATDFTKHMNERQSSDDRMRLLYVFLLASEINTSLQKERRMAVL